LGSPDERKDFPVEKVCKSGYGKHPFVSFPDADAVGLSGFFTVKSSE
jgi:hypothetical protein